MSNPILLPDLGAPEATFSLWFVSPGDPIYEGDRIAEVIVGAATVDVVSPADGRLQEVFAQPGEPLRPGQPIGSLVDDPA